MFIVLSAGFIFRPSEPPIVTAQRGSSGLLGRQMGGRNLSSFEKAPFLLGFWAAAHAAPNWQAAPCTGYFGQTKIAENPILFQRGLILLAFRDDGPRQFAPVRWAKPSRRANKGPSSLNLPRDLRGRRRLSQPSSSGRMQRRDWAYQFGA